MTSIFEPKITDKLRLARPSAKPPPEGPASKIAYGEGWKGGKSYTLYQALLPDKTVAMEELTRTSL